MISYGSERLAIFIDGANLYAAARALGFDIDYRQLLKWGSTKGQLIRAFYYTALLEDQEYSPIRPLVDWLDYNGFTMVTKPTKEFTDSFGRRKIKGNMDIELAIDVMEMTEHVQHIMLFSGDGDFRRLVEAVQRKGVRATVVSTMKSNPPMVADELRRQADNFIELADVAHNFQRSFTARDDGDHGHAPRGEGNPFGGSFDPPTGSGPGASSNSNTSSGASTGTPTAAAPSSANTNVTASADGEPVAERPRRGRPPGSGSSSSAAA